MNDLKSPMSQTLPDIQSHVDMRKLAIQAVGVRELVHPIEVAMGASANNASKLMTVAAKFSMAVALSAEKKGTHMSRFVELLMHNQVPYHHQSVHQLGAQMLKKLNADSGEINIRFPYFVRKQAPTSGAESWMDYEVGWDLTVNQQSSELMLVAKVPVTALCPCSKEVSEYGAHNQRSNISVRLQNDAMGFVELIEIIEAQASCALYGVLKRNDEKFITEQAYRNPKFVEDLVRDVAQQLLAQGAQQKFCVEAENFESIHNHNAFARIVNA